MKITSFFILTSSLLFSTASFAGIPQKLQFSAVSASPNCQRVGKELWNMPAILGLSKSEKSWKLRVKAPSLQAPDSYWLAELTLTDLFSQQKTLNFEKPKATRIENSDVFEFTIPLLRKLPDGNEIHRTFVVVNLHSNRNILTASTQVSIVNRLSQIRAYNYSGSCIKSLPPAIIRDKVVAPAVAFIPQDVQFDYDFTNEFELSSQHLSGVISLGYYRPIDSRDNWTVGQPSASTSLMSAQDYVNRRTTSTKVSHTFKIRPNTIGYIVANHAEHWVPYQDLYFSSCGQPAYETTDFKWESRILPAFSFLVTQPENEGNYTYLEQRLNEYPSYNTCKGRN